MYVLATNNPGKAREWQAIFKAAGLELKSLHDLKLEMPPPDETGGTFEANSRIKATVTADFLRDNGHKDVTVLADDSGLEIDAMNGAPGVDSALFLGADTPYEVRISSILKELANTPHRERSARFVCVITAVLPSGEILATRGELEGFIARDTKGENGFGYDPVFWVPEHEKHLAELTKEEKNKISHRGKALEKMLELL